MKDLIVKILREESTPLLSEQQMEYFPIKSDRFNIGYDRKGLGRGVKPKSLDRHTSIHNNDYNSRSHTGIDIFAPKGEPAYSPVTGKIIQLGRHGSAGGKGITITRDDNMHFRLVHMDSLDPNLEVGQTINAGDYFGTVGDSGNAKGTHPHIHFSIHGPDKVYRYSNDVDPCPYLQGFGFEVKCDRRSRNNDDQNDDNVPDIITNTIPQKRVDPDIVRELQDYLVIAGYLDDVDYKYGILDTDTIKAIKELQKEHNLTPDGEINKETVEALLKDVAESKSDN